MDKLGLICLMIGFDIYTYRQVCKIPLLYSAYTS